MKRLFIEIYQDEDVDVLIANLLRVRGFTVITTQEAQFLGKSDAQQLAYAVNHEMAFLTHNRVHIETLVREYFDKNKRHYGVIIASRRSAYEIARRLLLIVNHVTADEMINQVRYI